MRKINIGTILFGMILVIGGVGIIWTTLWNNLPSPFDIVEPSGKYGHLIPIIVPVSSSGSSVSLNSNPATAPTIIFEESYNHASSSEASDIPNPTPTPTAVPTVIAEESYSQTSSRGSGDIPNLTPTAAPMVIVEESYTPTISIGSNDIPYSTPTAAPTVIVEESYTPRSTPQPQSVGLIPDRLVIPIINLDAPIIPVSYKEIMVGNLVYYQWLGPDQFAVGWHASSAPLGLPGNTVLNGHHNAYGRVFKDLVRLGRGDVISIYSGSQEFRYQVVTNMLLPERFEPLSVRIENASWIAPSSDERITLITCWPANSDTHRVVVVAFPVGYSDINPVP